MPEQWHPRTPPRLPRKTEAPSRCHDSPVSRRSKDRLPTTVLTRSWGVSTTGADEFDSYRSWLDCRTRQLRRREYEAARLQDRDGIYPLPAERCKTRAHRYPRKLRRSLSCELAMYLASETAARCPS